MTKVELLKHILQSRIGTAIKGLTAILLIGTFGFYVLGVLHARGILTPKIDAHWPVFDCAYFTAITIGTVGYGETLPVKGDPRDFPDVRIYTMVVIFGGMIAAGYFLSSATAFFVEGDLARVIERRRMLKKISELRDHYIVCGAGQTGRHISEELASIKKPCVVIDDNAANVTALAELLGTKVYSIVGDALKDETLVEAGIDHARGLAATLPDDRDNLFLTISARQLNPKLRIISKAIDMPTKGKLLKAGADGVVSANYIGALRIASELVRPAVVNFLDQMLRKKDVSVRFAEVTVGKKSADMSLEELAIRKRCGLSVLAMKNPKQNDFIYNPGPSVRVAEGTVLVVMGEVEQVERLEEIVGDAGTTATFVAQADIKTTQMQMALPEELKDPRDNL